MIKITFMKKWSNHYVQNDTQVYKNDNQFALLELDKYSRKASDNCRRSLTLPKSGLFTRSAVNLVQLNKNTENRETK